MKNEYKVMREGIKSFPLALGLLSPKLQKIANQYMSKSVGIEIEIYTNNLNKEIFAHIGLLDLNLQGQEISFRISSGIQGMIQLYNTFEVLKQHAELNLKSGIHYHIDCTKEFNLITEKVRNNKLNWILNELDSWNYTGLYNERSVTFFKTQVKAHSDYKTLEFRIGEMTFDYELIMKRILHCQSIVKRVIMS